MTELKNESLFNKPSPEWIPPINNFIKCQSVNDSIKKLIVHHIIKINDGMFSNHLLKNLSRTF
jgi:hypothetical protein